MSVIESVPSSPRNRPRFYSRYWSRHRYPGRPPHHQTESYLCSCLPEQYSVLTDPTACVRCSVKNKDTGAFQSKLPQLSFAPQPQPQPQQSASMPPTLPPPPVAVYPMRCYVVPDAKISSEGPSSHETYTHTNPPTLETHARPSPWVPLAQLVAEDGYTGPDDQ
jgi:hypothetical protein